jgi:rhodanese-related sulfurtransferase
MLPLGARALLLMTAAGALGLGVNALRPDGVSLAAYAPPAVCGASSSPSRTASPPVSILTPAEAAGLCGDAGTVLADVRSASAFAEGHVTGAIHLPCAASGDVAAAAVALLAGKSRLVVYGDATADAATVAEEMRRRARLDVVVIEGGFAAWNQAGLACSSGPCPQCGAPHDHPGAR